MLTFGPDFRRPAAQHKGIAGIVLDGVVRDAARLRASDWPVFAAGVAVRPGDLVLGDDDGVVVIPIERAEAVAQQVMEKVEQESQRIAAIGQGVVSPAWLEAAMQRAGIVNT